MKSQILSCIFVIITFSVSAQLNHALRDENGRHVIGRGFVLVTNDSYFDCEDYMRMVRLGANFQVIRLELGRLSQFPGAKLDQEYLAKLDTLVQLGRNAGIKTVFKMTVYGLREFSWEAFWQNNNRQNEIYLDAWKIIWNRYKDDDSVVGYDLLNEPRKLEMDISYDELTKKYLLPLYRQLIDESHKINPEKYCLIQSIFMNKGEKINGNQYYEINYPLKRKNVLFAPHIYQENKALVKPALLRFEKESKVLEAPVFICEWGFPTFDKTDSNMNGRLGQLNYMDFYMRTAELFDSLGFNTIKAWFSGTPHKQNFLSGGPSTWAIFSDSQAVGTTERKYITDIIARPFPQAIAGDIQSFKYNFATRCLEIYLISDNRKGTSKIFIGANRHYPDGFSVVLNDSFIMYHDPLKNLGLEIHNLMNSSNPADFFWDENTQQLIIQKWPDDKAEIHVRIIPGIYTINHPVTHPKVSRIK